MGLQVMGLKLLFAKRSSEKASGVNVLLRFDQERPV
jgi:hypothetical protein